MELQKTSDQAAAYRLCHGDSHFYTENGGRMLIGNDAAESQKTIMFKFAVMRTSYPSSGKLEEEMCGLAVTHGHVR
jgi:hypothetical protein